MRFTASIITLCLICVALCGKSFAVSEDKFFSYKRFFLNQDIAGTFLDDGKVKKDLNRFALTFMRGLSEGSSERTIEARRSFLKARGIWPEYFNTDFVIALTYEDEGKYKIAARYYKSYLDKLEAFHKGEYRMYGSLIVSFTSGKIDSYESARALIKKHLTEFDIDLKKVNAPFTIPDFLVPVIVVLFLIVIYVINRYWISPSLRNRRLIKNPPEGFWVCPRCMAINPNPALECTECGRKRK